MKVCKDCQIDKPLSEFHNSKQTKDGKQYYCKPCQLIRVSKSPDQSSNIRKAGLRKKYGIDLDEYNRLFQKQQGVCAICSEKETANGKQNLSVDHDHKTGIVRGLLCHNCNTALGKFKDNTHILKSAIFYLEKTNLTIENKIRQILLNQMEETNEEK